MMVMLVLVGASVSLMLSGLEVKVSNRWGVLSWWDEVH
jgi:hypothetical protein